MEFRLGQVTTNVVPDFACQKWLGFKGTIKANPFLDICRWQTDIAIEGDWRRLLTDMRGFHWMTVYGDCRREVGYALRHLGWSGRISRRRAGVRRLARFREMVEA